MSCLLNSGLTQPCSYEMGGLRALYITNHASVNAITDEDTDNILDTVNFGTSGAVFYKVEFNKNTGTFVESMQIGANGNKFFLQTLNFSYSGTDQVTTDFFSTLGLSKVLVIVEKRNGERKVIFQENAGEATAIELVSGGAAGDAYGFTATLTSEANDLASEFLASATIAL